MLRVAAPPSRHTVISDSAADSSTPPWLISGYDELRCTLLHLNLRIWSGVLDTIGVAVNYSPIPSVPFNHRDPSETLMCSDEPRSMPLTWSKAKGTPHRDLTNEGNHRLKSQDLFLVTTSIASSTVAVDSPISEEDLNAILTADEVWHTRVTTTTQSRDPRSVARSTFRHPHRCTHHPDGAVLRRDLQLQLFVVKLQTVS